MKNILINNLYTAHVISTVQTLVRGGEELVKVVGTHSIIDAQDEFRELHIDKYLRENSGQWVIVETTNFLIIPTNLSFGYGGEGPHGLLYTLNLFGVNTEKLEGVILNHNTDYINITKNTFDYRVKE